MNKKQKVILSLLQEIDEICRRNKIEYYLSPRLTLCAVEGHPFPQNPMFGVVLMKTVDMELILLCALMAAIGAFGLVTGVVLLFGIQFQECNAALLTGIVCGLWGILWGSLLIQNRNLVSKNV